MEGSGKDDLQKEKPELGDEIPLEPDLVRTSADCHRQPGMSTIMDDDGWPLDNNKKNNNDKDNDFLSAIAEGDLTRIKRHLDEDDGAASLAATDSTGQTPLHRACSRGDTEIISLLLQHGCDLHVRDLAGNAPLNLACLAGREEAVSLLLHAGAEVDRMGNDGSSALHMVAERGDARIASMLLDAGAEVNCMDNEARTPLHRAAAAGMEEMVGVLLERGARVDVVDRWGSPALYFGVIGKRLGVLEALLRHGHEVNARDGNGDTALHYACRGKWVEGIEVLLAHGADVGIRNADQLTALNVAADADAREIRAMFLRHRSTSDSESEWSVPVRRRWSRSRVVRLSGHDTQTESDAEAEIEIETDAAALESEGSIAGPSIEPPGDLWAGVIRDNGDGFTLASYDKHDISFDAKLESLCACVHEGKSMHEIRLKLNFMRPYSMDYRIRYAKIDVLLSAGEAGEPNIRGIMPQADRMEVSEQEISSGQRFTVGAAGSGPSNVNISMEGSKSRRAIFKGVRIIHGAVKDRMHASWRLYEEPGSKSGLPEIVRLLLLVDSEAEFGIRLSMAVKACHRFTFGIPRTMTAAAGRSYQVPPLGVISLYEQESRLKQMLAVAGRAATVAEEADRLEARFSRAIRNHAKRDLILQAGMKESHSQEWVDIVDASLLNDFRNLREKLLEMEDRKRRSRRRSRTSNPRLQRELEERILLEESWRRDRHLRTEPRGDRYPVVEEHPRAKNALESFSAVGPGYHVSRLA